VFPSLLKKLMEKDFGSAIRSGFECTGIYPVNPERVLSKLPKEQREVDTDIQQQLLNRLNLMRYSPGPNTKAPRPKKKDKLPAGASYTCTPEGAVVALPDDGDVESPLPAPPAPKRARQRQPDGDASSRDDSSSQESDSESNSDNSSSDDEDSSSGGDMSDSEVSSSEELGTGIRAIVQRHKKKLLEKEERKKKKMQEKEDRQKAEEGERPRKKDAERQSTDISEGEMSAEKETCQYKPGSYVVVLYERDWYVAQVLDKEQEQQAERDENYVFLNFMKKTHTGDSLQWPSKTDVLNVLREDILFSCAPPHPQCRHFL
jgi:hypothetical protein